MHNYESCSFYVEYSSQHSWFLVTQVSKLKVFLLKEATLESQTKVAAAIFHHITFLFSYIYKLELYCPLTCLPLII